MILCLMYESFADYILKMAAMTRLSFNIGPYGNFHFNFSSINFVLATECQVSDYRLL